MHFNMKKTKFRRMSIISNSFDVRTSQRVKNKNHTEDPDDKKKDKQLLTPNIKRFLKKWLLDHKDYPYPDRYEKIMLAQETGLTIMQICNWFANWRRKLKLYSKDFKRRSYKVAEDKTDSDEVEDDSDDTRTPHSWTSPQPSSQPDADWSRQRLSKPSEALPKAPKLWRPQEDLEDKDLMLLKWLKSISTFDSIKYHPCYTKYVWDSDRVRQLLHEDTPAHAQYGYDRLSDHRYNEHFSAVSADHKYNERLNADADHKYSERLNANADHKYNERLNADADHRYNEKLNADTDHKYYERLNADTNHKYFEPLSSPDSHTGYIKYESFSYSSGSAKEYARSGCDVHLDEVRQSDEILAAEILASFAQNRQAAY